MRVLRDTAEVKGEGDARTITSSNRVIGRFSFWDVGRVVYSEELKG